MLSEQLDALKVKNAKAGKHRDGKGLILLVKPTGAKSWVLRVQHDGKRRDYGLGSLDTLSLSDARKKAAEARAWVKQGKDPVEEWASYSRTVPTFGEVAVQCHAALKDDWRNAKHSKQWLSTLELHAFPVIGSMPVDKIDSDELAQVLRPIWLTIPETAKRVRYRMGAVLDYAKAMKLRETSAPLGSLQFLLPKQKNARKKLYRKHPSIPYVEMPSFMGKLKGLDVTIPRLALSFQILSAARTNEIRFARWSEIDGDIWRLPGERMKTGEPHEVYLSPAAVAVLDEVKELGLMSLDDLIFVGATGGAMSNRAMLKVMNGIEAVDKDNVPATVHGNRATFRTWAQEQRKELPEAVGELCLSHRQNADVMARYARGEFVADRIELMDDWARFVTSRCDNVTRLAV